MRSYEADSRRYRSSPITIGRQVLDYRVGYTSRQRTPRSPSTGDISIHYMGKFLLKVDGVAVGRWRAGRAQRLFQYLALRHDQPISSEALNEVLWPGSWERQSSGLKVAVHALRNVLATAQRNGAGDRRRSAIELRSCSGGYVLETKNVSIDFEELASNVELAKELERNGETESALHCYHIAAACYRGDFLDGESEHWVYSWREWLKDLTLRSLERVVDDAVRRHDYDSAISWSHRMLDIEPYREETYRVLILSHARLGRLGRAKRLYELCRDRLRNELDMEPDADTKRLFARATRGGLTNGGEEGAEGPASAVG
jgi:DNA-binding SARP family transcriptional activator